MSSSIINILSSSSSMLVPNTTRGDPCNLPAKLRTIDESLICVVDYIPNDVLPIIALVLFGLVFLVLFIQNIRSKSLLMAWVTATAALEIGGYIARIIVIDSFPDNSFLAMTILLVISPNLLALVNYTVLGKLIAISIESDEIAKQTTNQLSNDQTVDSMKSNNQTTAKSSRFKSLFIRPDRKLNPNFIAVFFLFSDLASLTVQSISASYLTDRDPSKRVTGNDIMKGGLAVPLLFFTCFTIMGIYILFNKNYNQPMTQSNNHSINQFSSMKEVNQMLIQTPSLRKVWFGLLSTMVLLGLRNIYRFLEYALGADNDVAASEPVFYVFDTLMVLGSLIIYSYTDFGHYLPKARQERLELAGMNRTDIQMTSIKTIDLPMKHASPSQVGPEPETDKSDFKQTKSIEAQPVEHSDN